MGADAGFASIIGLAVLVLLYFAQARETATLREQAELAAQRVAQLESRLAHAAAVQSSQVAAAPIPSIQPPPPGVVPAAGYQPAPALGVVPSPAPPAGVAAPPLSAATKLIPSPPPVRVGGVAAASMAAASGRPPLPGSPVSVPPIGVPPVGASPVGASPVPASPVGAGPTASPPLIPPPGPPPPVNRIVTPRPATAAGGATASNGTGDHPVIPPPVPMPTRPPVQIRPGASAARKPSMLDHLTDGPGTAPSGLTKALTALAAIAVVAAIVIVLIQVTSGPASTASRSSHRTTVVSNAPKPHHHATRPPIDKASVAVTVLNGTGIYLLANTISQQLANDGFKQGSMPTNAATQTQPNTTVEYAQGDQRDAAAVAKALNLGSSAVQAMTPDTQSLGCPQGAPCNVVVTVGADLANTPTNQTQTTG